MHNRVLRFGRTNLAFLTAILCLCPMSDFRFHQTQRSYGTDPDKDDN
jgi:hypothetical protein